ncbi:MAG: SMC-Scp complex subunit ScpB [Actinomycetaceae bacterium]|nr:SMC-Scp complex subunit ScpB [Actinomycetaceae bacterium]MDY6083189.1 SMC-Scp complex subunit ScpB [Actinomycetaceae bacterium]
MSDDNLRGALEALLFIADKPQSADDLARMLREDVSRVEETLTLLRDEYSNAQPARGFVLRHVGGGWRLYTNPEFSALITQTLVAGSHARLSAAALETLAVIAYQQPVTRAQVASIRGVNSDSVVRTLLMHGLIEESGETATGATEYSTTAYFLEVMGMNSLDELAPLAPYLPEVGSVREEGESE